MPIPQNYDFSGWATKNDLTCADGLVIRKGAFSANDGQKVPLCWNHEHNDPSRVLGHAILENRDNGVYAYGYLNNTPAGKDAKEALKHGDIVALSIWANNLQKNGPEVLHGSIREVSLVLAGANPGAFVESVIQHGEPMDEYDDEGIFHTGEELILAHAEPEQKEEEPGMAKRSIPDIYNDMTEEQKEAVAAIVGMSLSHSAVEDDEEEEMDEKEEDVEDDEKDDEEEEDKVKHNIFDQETDTMGGAVLSHSDMRTIFETAKRTGSLKEAINDYIDSHDELAHALTIDKTGMETAKGTQTYGFNDPEMLFPEFRAMSNQPEWLSRNMDWVNKVMSGVHRTPFSRIKSVYADITEDDARARGYIKGKQKKEEVFTLLKRTTEPQTIYKKQKMDRDDIIDITDFDVVAWIRAEMRVMLNEEIARAILIGDGRQSDSDDKIKEDKIRPIVKDVALYNTVVEVPNDSDDQVRAKSIINKIIKARKNYKGSGNPTFFTTEDILTDLLLLEDGIGHKLYKTETELATALRVREIVTVEPMEGYEVEISSTKYPLIGVIVNLNDYNVGADKGGEINMFDDFDIDFNQFKYLIETRISGALIKPFSALTIVFDKANP